MYDSWHAAFVLKTADLAAAVIPESDDFPGAEHVEFSWGDADYFPAEEASIRLALRAAFASRGSVLHLVGIDRPLREQFRSAEIVQLRLSGEQFHRLAQFLSRHFRRDEVTARGVAAPGLTPTGRFYRSTGKFSLIRTCNTWVAEGLEYAGLPVSSGFVISAAGLARRVRPLGVVIE